MDFKSLLDDERAVSPVIGVILMVAITVILAAVIGSFVLGLGSQVQQTTPQANFGFSTGTETINDDIDSPGDGDGVVESDLDVTSVTVTHETGSSIAKSNLELKVNGATAYGVTPDAGDQNHNVKRVFDGSGDVTAGTSVTIVAATSEDLLFDAGTPQYDPDASSPQEFDVLAGDGTRYSNVGLASEDEIRVVWTSDSGDNSATLGTFEIP